MSRAEAENYLYGLWEDGLVPSNFTEDHSQYELAIEYVIEHNELDWSDFQANYI